MGKLLTLKISLRHYLADPLKTPIICKEEAPSYFLPEGTSVLARMSYDPSQTSYRDHKLSRRMMKSLTKKSIQGFVNQKMKAEKERRSQTFKILLFTCM